MFEKIILGCDHGAIHVKDRVKQILEERNIPYEDLGINDPDIAVDYPIIAKQVTEKVSGNVGGILSCGSGSGMCIAANKQKGIRAALAYDEYSARMSRFDNDANVLCLRGREFPIEKIDEIVNAWLDTDFSDLDRHKRRIAEVAKLE